MQKKLYHSCLTEFETGFETYISITRVSFADSLKNITLFYDYIDYHRIDVGLTKIQRVITNSNPPGSKTKHVINI